MTATNYETWAAGMTLRWHSNRHMRDANDTVDAHSARMARMAFGLFNDPWLATVCLYHDLAESIVGDMPFPAKKMLPALRKVEAKIDAEKGWAFQICPEEASRLRLFDRLDAYLIMLHHKPRLSKRDDWNADLADLLALADELAVGDAVREMIREARG
jgi:5'-deoxynucleotidase YfbR-like HD superfamily hydrolase